MYSKPGKMTTPQVRFADTMIPSSLKLVTRSRASSPKRTGGVPRCVTGRVNVISMVFVLSGLIFIRLGLDHSHDWSEAT